MSLVIDTSAVLAFLNRADPNHGVVADILMREPGAVILPVGILSEIFYLIELRLGSKVFALFCDDLVGGNFTLDCGVNDLWEIKTLAGRYDNLPLGFSDAAVICCAMRTARRILSLDRRDFEVVQRELRFELLP